MSLRKFEIHFDEEKVKAYGKYTTEQLYSMLDTLMKHRNIDILNQGVQQTKEDTDKTHDMFFAFLMALTKTEWFIANVDKWLYYHDGDVEDCLEEHKRFLEKENG